MKDIKFESYIEKFEFLTYNLYSFEFSNLNISFSNVIILKRWCEGWSWGEKYSFGSYIKNMILDFSISKAYEKATVFINKNWWWVDIWTFQIYWWKIVFSSKLGWEAQSAIKKSKTKLDHIWYKSLINNLPCTLSFSSSFFRPPAHHHHHHFRIKTFTKHFIIS